LELLYYKYNLLYIPNKLNILELALELGMAFELALVLALELEWELD